MMGGWHVDSGVLRRRRHALERLHVPRRVHPVIVLRRSALSLEGGLTLDYLPVTGLVELAAVWVVCCRYGCGESRRVAWRLIELLAGEGGMIIWR